MYDVHNTHFTFLLMYFRGNFCPIEPNQNANGNKIQLHCRLTLMAIWTGVNPLRFSSLSAPVNSVPKREVKSGSNGVWPAEQTQCNKLLPRWSVRFRINVDSKPSVTSSCGRRRKKAMMNCAFFPCNYTHIFGRFRTAEKNHLERGTPTALLNIRLRGSTPYT